MSISSFNKLGGSGREILQVSLLLVAKITAGVPRPRCAGGASKHRLSLCSSQEAARTPSFPIGTVFSTEGSQDTSHPPLPRPQAPALGAPGGLLGGKRRPGQTSGCSTEPSTLPQASWPPNRLQMVQGGETKGCCSCQGNESVLSTSCLKTPQTSIVPSPLQGCAWSITGRVKFTGRRWTFLCLFPELFEGVHLSCPPSPNPAAVVQPFFLPAVRAGGTLTHSQDTGPDGHGAPLVPVFQARLASRDPGGAGWRARG